MRILTFALLLALTVLNACAGPAAETVTYSPPQTPGGRMCSLQCQDAADYCRQSCDLDNRQCVSEEQTRAILDFDKYTRDQFAAHQPIEFMPRDFDREQPCIDRHKSCVSACDAPFQSCYKNCGGTVTVTSSCQFLCF